jgi:fused signal recognition particle receptor
MRRWFRRKDKEEERREEGAEASRLEETESSSAAAEDVAPSAEEPILSEPEALGATPSEAETGAALEPRRGLFRRWGRGLPAEEAAPAPLEDAAASSEAIGIDLSPPPLESERPPEPPPLPEPAPPPVVPISPEPGLAAAPPEAGEEETPPEIPESEDLEEPGEVSEAVRRKRFQRLRERLKRTREALSGGLDRVFRGRKVVDAALLDDLEELLITADLGVETSLFLIQALQEKLKRRELREVERLKAALKSEMVALLTGPAPRERSARPWVVLLVGVNGVGKTTTIAKLAYRDRHRGLTPLLVAADTFRAAAVEQLEIWGERAGAAVVKQKTGADPAAVVFDGLAAASARGADTVYVDTAGRLHTKVNLMEELKKIHRTAAKKIPGAPHEVFLVLDATTGQNALNQARLFHEAVGVTGLILTKMDGTAKGGVALAVVHETGIPLRYIGVGEAMEDLRPFDAAAFVEAILG